MKVFYSPRQSVLQNNSCSPSAGKPEQVVAQWRERYPVELVTPEPVTAAQLSLAHDPDYVRDVLECRACNGFGNTSPAVAASLPWTTGSFVSAARHVLTHGGAACSPTSGFHHACWSRGGGFCTFNGLMVAALLVRDIVDRVGILDCDYHYGNGTDDIIGRLRLDSVGHCSSGHPLSAGLSGRERNPDYFLEHLPQILEDLQAGVLFYQAGADAHVDDPLGGWMDAGQLRRRDRIVFEFCHTHGIPVVWNLAGGYQDDFQKVLDLHHATMEECLRFFP